MVIRGITILKFLFGFFLGNALYTSFEKIFNKNIHPKSSFDCQHATQTTAWAPNITIFQKVEQETETEIKILIFRAE